MQKLVIGNLSMIAGLCDACLLLIKAKLAKGVKAV